MLFHEYVHIRRLDTMGKLIAAATICIHWFNPMVWVLYILFNRDIELASDERVVRHFGENDRATYARMLIGMEEQRSSFATFYNYFAKDAIEERIESKHQIYSLIGDKIVGDITPADIKSVLNHWMNKGYAYTTVKKVHNLLTDYFRYLAQQELIPKNPMLAAPMIKKANFMASQGRPLFG